MVIGDAGNVLRHVRPCRASVATQLDVAVVRSHPQHSGKNGRLSQRGYVAIVPGSVVLRRHGLITRDAHYWELVAVDGLGQIAARRPCFSPIHGLEELIGPSVDGSRVMRRNLDRRAPVESVFLAGRRSGHDVARSRTAESALALRRGLRCVSGGRRLSSGWRSRLRRGSRPLASWTALAWTGGGARPYVDASARSHVQALHIAALGFDVDGVVISRIDLNVKSIASADSIPVRVTDARVASGRARPSPCSVVLKAAIDEVRLAHIDRDRISLRQCDRVHEFPRRALIVSHIQSAVVADDHMIVVLRIDPDRVMIAVSYSLQDLKRFATIG